MQGKTQRKKIMHKIGRILMLNHNYNSLREVFQNAPNDIRGCLERGLLASMGFNDMMHAMHGILSKIINYYKWEAVSSFLKKKKHVGGKKSKEKKRSKLCPAVC